MASPKNRDSVGEPTLARCLSTPNMKIPEWFSTKCLTKKRYLSPSTGNLHGLRAEDYFRVQWPLPRMFGDEKYAFGVIDIDDPRYETEAVEMGKKLVRLFYDQQIMDLEWRNTYKKLLMAEHRRATLASDAQQRTKDKMDAEVTSAKKYLLELQDQKDLYRCCTEEIWARCDHIKATIKAETDLEELRLELTNRVKTRYARDDAFWKSSFNVSSNAPDAFSKPLDF